MSRDEISPAERGATMRSETQVGPSRRWSRLRAWIPGQAGPWRGLNIVAVGEDEAGGQSDLHESISALRAGKAGAVSELDEQGGEVGGRVGFGVERDAGDRVGEAEGLGVEGLAMEGDPGRREEAWTIDGIADDRQSDRREVHADLVGATRQTGSLF